MEAFEVNFDGLVGPTHNYSGLSYGNLPSMKSQNTISNPREAALQGLNKMKFLADMGLKQGIFPPHERPYLPMLKILGFTGSHKHIVEQTLKNFPELYEACCSAAPMWVANAATVCPSIDSADRHVHFTPANLSNKFHRSFEWETTAKILKAIFANPHFFVHHAALPAGPNFSDEGAANHTRFCSKYGNPGVQLFVFGKSSFHPSALEPVKFPARQTQEASQSITRLHQLYADQFVLAQQNPAAIDAGVFHNDVISVGNQHLFFYHENAFVGTEDIVRQLQLKVRQICDQELHLIKVPAQRIPFQLAVQSYLFNSQIVTLPDQTMKLIAPLECQQIPEVEQFLNELIQTPANPIASIDYLNLKESMQNGGGPACLRLRVVLNESELAAVNPAVFMTERLYERLTEWIQKHYRTHLTSKDLADPKLIEEAQTALNELTKILNLGPIYSFQH